MVIQRWMWVCLWMVVGVIFVVCGLRFIHHWSEKQSGGE